MKAFTYYWKNDSWQHDAAFEGEPLRHAAGSDFTSRGVEIGDHVFIVSIFDGKLFLCGRMTVDRIRDQRDTEAELGHTVWAAPEHIISDHGTPMHFRRQVADEITERMRFGDGQRLAFDAPGRLNVQTLRGVRHLAPESADLLDTLIHGEDDANTPAEKPHLKFVKTVEEVADNFRTFQREARLYPARTASILRSTWYWLRDANSGAFGPGKFLGYRGMDFGIYEVAGRGPDRHMGVPFDGYRSRVAIERVLDMHFQDEHERVVELQQWGERTFGDGAFGGANKEKWRFLTFAIPGRELLTDYPDEIPQPETFYEGAIRTVSVNVYERDDRARAACIAHYGTTCTVCGLDFVERYGRIGEGFIHVHHLKPLAEIGEAYRVDPIRDLRPLCPNCHGMIHRRSPCFTIDELKGMIRDTP